MSGSDTSGSDTPLFVLATRLYVHYKFKTRKSFNPQAALIDDEYAREVLRDVRAAGDRKLKEMASLFEAARFPGAAAPPAPGPRAAPSSKDREEPMLDLPLESPS